MSLLTIEYDVGEDEPERTEVFRLQSAVIETRRKVLNKASLYLDVSFGEAKLERNFLHLR